MSTERPLPGAGTTIRATVAADGAAAAAPPMLQGEGAIEGSYRSYKVPPDPTTTPPYAIQCSGGFPPPLLSRFPPSPPVPASKLHPLPFQVKYVSDHGPGSFAYSRFKCAAPPVEAQSRD